MRESLSAPEQSFCGPNGACHLAISLKINNYLGCRGWMGRPVDRDTQARRPLMGTTTEPVSRDVPRLEQ